MTTDTDRAVPTTSSPTRQSDNKVDRSKIRMHRQPGSDQRSADEICHHYAVERELSDQLRHSNKEDRKQLYTSLYDEICKRVPNIPGWNVPLPPDALRRSVENKVKFLKQLATDDATYLEIGPGDCSVSLAMADKVGKVIAVDVSTEITRNLSTPDNFEIIISDGTSIDVPEQSVDVAYSNQLMEHLHPDDALEQLENVFRSLKPGGAYICVTPNKLSGPHDVSKYFDDTPTGFHLKEYSTTELASIFRNAGFGKVNPYIWVKEKLIVLPLMPVQVLETTLGWLPGRLRRYFCNRSPINHILGRVIAVRPR
ncbi:class I SAM-dependent methyltransferase [Novipirellula sp. SH528]|uniref:class I SAM-dependent methyltransferase n=1 Tax=Novipirellula sp. SH528 TaxID=3454466 RepID=UPI003F9F9F54